MQTTSALYQQILADQNHHFDVRLTIYTGTGTQVYRSWVRGELFSLSTSHAVFPTNVPSIGGAVAGTIDCVILPTNADAIPPMARMAVEVQAVSDTLESEWIPKGTYYIDTREQSENAENLKLLKIHGYDAMLKFEQMYPGDNSIFAPDDIVVDGVRTYNSPYLKDSDLSIRIGTTNIYSGLYWGIGQSADEESLMPLDESNYSVDSNGISLSAEWLNDLNAGTYCIYSAVEWEIGAETVYTFSRIGYFRVIAQDTSDYPMLDVDMVSLMAQTIGITVDQRTIDIMDAGFEFQLPTGYTMREMLGYIASAYGGNFVISDEGKLLLIALGDFPPETNYLIDEHNNVLVFGDTRILV